ncbi:MAG: CHAT domain-containing protein [Synechococcales bacterium]|nr:CHAT domain-containing protein [Synechococcales bacterium]
MSSSSSLSPILGLFALSIGLSAGSAQAANLSKVLPVDPVAVSQPTTAQHPLDQGRQFYSKGQFKEAIEAWEKAAQQFSSTGDSSNQILALNYLSLAHQELSQWDQAKRAIESSRKLIQGQPTSAALSAKIYNTHANLKLSTGQPQAALGDWEQAEKLYRQAKDSIGAIGTQINQAQAMKTLGFYRRAQQKLESLESQIMILPDSDLKANALHNYGAALQVVGDLETAKNIFAESLRVTKAVGSNRETSSILLSLGQTHWYLGEWEQAIGDFQEAEKQASNPLDQLQAQIHQLEVAIEAKQTSQTKELAQKIHQKLQTLAPNRTSIYLTIRFVAMLTRLDPSAIPIETRKLATQLATSAQAAQNLQDPQAEAYALIQLAHLYRLSGQPAESLQLSQQALAIARQIQVKEITSQAAWQVGRSLKQQNQRAQAIEAYTEAVNALKDLRQDLVAINSDVQFSFRDSIEPIYRELVALLLEKRPNQDELKQARSLMEALQLAELDNFFREACLDTQAQQIDQLDQSASVIYPILLEDRIAVIASTAGQPLVYHETPITRNQVEDTLNEFLASLNPVSDKRDRFRLSKQIYDWLIRPIESAPELSQAKTLVFVSDGALRNIPMPALYDGKQYLVEKYAVALSPGMQLMQTRSRPTEMGAIVAGISEARQGFNALPEVKTEVKQISQLVAAQTLLNQEFTVNTLADRVKYNPAGIVHLATHGQFSSRMEDTYLLTWEGPMNVRELSNLLQTRENVAQGGAIELLVLSACDTAAGDNRATLGLAGLAVKSGARSTLATLWPVKDKAAASLMEKFYANLRQPGMTKAQALQQAQKSMIASDYEDPFFWSAFVLVGNWL